jgi:hypothetical protein
VPCPLYKHYLPVQLAALQSLSCISQYSIIFLAIGYTKLPRYEKLVIQKCLWKLQVLNIMLDYDYPVLVPVATRLLRLWVRIPPGAWMFVCCECCVLLGRGLCDELITRPEESYRIWCVVVCNLETSWMRKPCPALCRNLPPPNIYIYIYIVYCELRRTVLMTINPSFYLGVGSCRTVRRRGSTLSTYR